jgi:hypothetical protein
VQPGDIISITKKYDGTSGISAHVLCKTELGWKQKISKWLTGEEFFKYDFLFSSRKVIRNPFYNPGFNKKGGGYYGEGGLVYDAADEYLRPYLEKSMTLYYEIIGYLPTGAFIQKNNDFGMKCPVVGGDYKIGENFDVRIYRVTLTNIEGVVHEFSPREVQTWCIDRCLKPVHEYYYGYAKDLYPDLVVDDSWCDNFIERLSNDANFDMELQESECINDVPAEGIVIKIDNMRSEAFKLKTFAHLDKKQKLLDKGKSDMEETTK